MLHFARPLMRLNRLARKARLQSKWKPLPSIRSRVSLASRFSALLMSPIQWGKKSKTLRKAKQTELPLHCKSSKRLLRLTRGEVGYDANRIDTDMPKSACG